MESNDNLSLEQITIIEKVEKVYETSDRWKMLVGRHGEYAVLHHPYTDLISKAGEVLLSTLQESVPASYQKTVENLKKFVPMILDEGGTLTLDNEFEIGFLSLITDSYPSKGDLFKISKAVWEQRVIEYVKGVVPMFEKAASLEDTQKNEDNVGYVRNDLLNSIAFLQTYLIAKTQGIEVVKEYMPQLQEGKVIYGPS
jgi:hypothetical protein|tara:strand:- start:2248 stop:2841 length:594 start_codon:yes stop_codon:yes gene_type:complete